MARPIPQVLRAEVVHNGYPVVRPDKLLRAVKPRRGDAQNCERIFAEPHRRPDYAGIGVKCASPKTIAQYHIRRRVRTVHVRLVEEPSQFRLHAQQIEIVAGSRVARDTFHRVTPA